jgi:hypothetical protein
MGEKKALSFADFKDVTEHIYMAVDKMDTLFKSMELTEAQQSELGRLGGLLHAVSHEIGHFYTGLEFLPKAMRDELEDYYGHGH